MYYVNKIIGWALSPLGFMFLGCLGGALLRVLGDRFGKRSLRRLGTALIFFAFSLLWFFSCNVATRFIGVPLEGEEAPLADTLELGGATRSSSWAAAWGRTRDADARRCSRRPITFGRRRVSGRRIRTATLRLTPEKAMR